MWRPAESIGHLRAWPARSQITARRNALLASTILAQRRREHREA